MTSRGEITGDKHHSGVNLSKQKSDSDLICEEKRSLIFCHRHPRKKQQDVRWRKERWLTSRSATSVHFGDENSDDELLRMSRSDSRRNSLETRARM